MVDTQLAEAFRVLLLEVARWRPQALEDPEEYARRDRILLQLEQVAGDVVPIAGRGGLSKTEPPLTPPSQ